MQQSARIVVGGNATLDYIVDGSIYVQGEKEDTVIVDSQGMVEKFKVADPPIRPGFKHRVNRKLDQDVMELWHCVKPGGGGYHSVTAMQSLPGTENVELDLVYMDVSEPHVKNIKGLQKYGVKFHFFYQREVPVNAILGWRDDKITLKGPQLDRVEPSNTHIGELEGLLSGSAFRVREPVDFPVVNAVLVNSFKDPAYAEQILRICGEKDIPLYFVITTSLEKDFVYAKVLPNAVGILNYDEIPAIDGINEKLDDQSKLELARETIKKIRIDGINSTHPIFVTLGKNGVYCSEGSSSIEHIYLNRSIAEQVNNGGSFKREGTSGAGDVFAAAVTLYRTLNPQISVGELARKASQAAIRYIGYSGRLSPSTFAMDRMEFSRISVVHSR